MKAIFKRELSALFTSMRAWLFLLGMLAAASACALINNLTGRNPQFLENAQYLAMALAVLVPLLTAPTFASDAKAHTQRLLFTLPIKPQGMVLGRFFACMIPVAIACALILIYPAALSFLGGVGMGACVGMAVMLLCMGALMAAVSLMISSMCGAPWLAYLISVAVFAASYFLPLLVNQLLAVTAMSTPLMLGLMLLVFAAVLLVTRSVFVGIICTAIADVPMFISRMQDGGAKAVHAAGKILARLAVFDGLGDLALGIVDVQTMISYLSLAALALVVAILCVRGKREGERRALA